MEGGGLRTRRLLLGLLICFLGHSLPVTSFTASGRVIMFSSTVHPVPMVFQLRGFSYSNYRIGEGPNAATDGPNGFDSLSRPEICDQDFGLMRALNVNGIKVYDMNLVAGNISALHRACFDRAWNGGTNPIFLILALWVPNLPFASGDDRRSMVAAYSNLVSATADHPAVMGYSIGSEIGGDPNDNPPYWKDFILLGNAIRSSLNGRKKIVTTGTYQADCTSCTPVVPCLGHVINGEKFGAGAVVDVWGVDIYSPNPSDPILMHNIFSATTKPFFLPEYGVNYQPPLSVDSQTQILFAQIKGLVQYSYDSSNTNMNQGNTSYNPSGPIYAGGLIFEWIDEYWKGGPLCQPNPGSAQPYYGANQVALQSGCQCNGNFAGICATDVRVPRPILGSGMLPALWPKYTPAALGD
jgi:hypothetical protein